MGGHRRDQSDSHVPLRQNDFQDQQGDTHELRVRTDSLQGMENGRLAFDPVDPGPSGIAEMLPSPGDRWRREALRTFVAFLCLLISAFLNFFLLTVIHDVVPREPLPDLVFMVIPQQRWAWVVGDVFSTIKYLPSLLQSLIVMAFSAVVGFAVVLLHRSRLVVLRRVLLLGAIMYGLRAICLGVTFLPPAFHDREEICQPQVNRTAMYAMEIATRYELPPTCHPVMFRFMTYVVTMGLTSGQEKILCGDLMFSGHTVVLTIMYFTQLQYTPRGLVALRYMATPITFLGIAALVVSGGHYTMDVLIAYWLTSHVRAFFHRLSSILQVFWGYHQMFELPRAKRPLAPMSRLWWFWLCYWFETELPDTPMVNEWDWPFPGPQIMHDLINTCNEKLK